MPGGDRTGPAGQGPMTGRGLGLCGASANAPDQRVGYGRGFGFNRGGQMGFGRGRRFGWQGQYAPVQYAPVNAPATNEIQELKSQVETLTKKLDDFMSGKGTN